jgi:hypothetical protein
MLESDSKAAERSRVCTTKVREKGALSGCRECVCVCARARVQRERRDEGTRATATLAYPWIKRNLQDRLRQQLASLTGTMKQLRGVRSTHWEVEHQDLHKVNA